MIRWITIVGLVIHCMAISLAFAETWMDSFEDGNLDGWRIYTFSDALFAEIPSAGKCRVENGVVIVGDDNPAVGHGVIMTMPETCRLWKDYTAEVSFRLPKPMRDCPEGSLVSMFVRKKDHPSRSYCFGIWNFNGEFAVGDIMMDGGDITISKTPFVAEANRWYRLKMSVEGDIVSCFIDEEKIAEFEGGNRCPSGCPGFGVEGVVTEFDNFVVTGPEIPNGGPAFAITPRNKLATMWGSVKSSR